MNKGWVNFSCNLVQFRGNKKNPPNFDGFSFY